MKGSEIVENSNLRIIKGPNPFFFNFILFKDLFQIWGHNGKIVFQIRFNYILDFYKITENHVQLVQVELEGGTKCISLF